MKIMTLREVCESMNISRRVVQGYEKAKLVSATGKNEYGYLLYDEEAQNRIRQIRLYQELGFMIKEIKEIIDAPIDIRNERIRKQIKKIEEEKKMMDVRISKANELIK